MRRQSRTEGVPGSHERQPEAEVNPTVPEELVALVREELREELARAVEELREGLLAASEQSPESLEPMLSVADVAALLACDPRSVHRWWREGAIPPPVRIGRVLRWYAPTVRDWLMARSDEETPNFGGLR